MAEGQLMRYLTKTKRKHEVDESIRLQGISPSVDRSLTPGRKSTLQHDTLQPCRSAYWICRQVIKERSKKNNNQLSLHAYLAGGAKFCVKPVLSYNKRGWKQNITTLFVVNEMVPPTNSCTRIVVNTHIIIKLCREFRGNSMPSAQVVHDRGHG